MKKAREYHWQAINTLIAEDASKEQLKSTPATIFDILRATATFFLQQRMLEDAFKLHVRTVQVAEAFEIESTLFKSLCAQVLFFCPCVNQTRLTPDVVPCCCRLSLQ